MSSQNDRQKVVSLERMNAELRGSLDDCRKLLADCRSRLAATSDELPLFRWGRGECRSTKAEKDRVPDKRGSGS